MPEDRTRDDVLVRITDDPRLARAVPRLRPEVLHAVITKYGLQDSGDLVALATPQQLSAVFDLDLWKASRAGADEEFDPARFAEWLEVLVDVDPAIAADRLARQDVALVVAGIAPNIRVLDPGVFEPIDSEIQRTGADAVQNPGRERGVHAEIGGYVVVARRTHAWDAIVDVLVALDEHHSAVFHRLMRACRRLSDAGHEDDGLDELLSSGEQLRFDLSKSREQRRDLLGFLPHDQARAFLEAARHLPLASHAPPEDPVFLAYRRALGVQSDPVTGGHDTQEQEASTDAEPEIVQVIALLSEAGVITDPRRTLPSGSQEAPSRNAALQAYLARQGDSAGEWIAREQTLGFLANVLVGGCSIRGRSFTAREAGDAVAATCNLGLEYWPAHWGSASTADLVTAFKIGWSVLYREVLVKCADGIVAALDEIQTTDQNLQFDLRRLRHELRRACHDGAPWRVCERLEVLSPLDLPAWAGLTALLDEYPVMLANVSGGRLTHKFNPSEFECIATAAHVAAVHEFLSSLAVLLTS